MQSQQTIKAELKERVLWLTLSRPEKLNALTREMYQALAAQLQAAGADPQVRAVVISGKGAAFSAGTDLKGLEGRTDLTNDGSGSPAMSFIRALAGCDKPVIAAVNGLAVGIGVTLLLHCDLVYAARSATFRMPFVNLGVVPEAGSSLLLPQRVGGLRAAEWLLLGDRFDADQACDAGLVNGVVEDGALLSRVTDVARRLVAQPPEAVRLTRQLLAQAPQPLERRIDEEMALFVRLLESDDAREARRALAEKRTPVFS